MREVDLAGIERRYVVPAVPRMARWMQLLGFAVAVVGLVLHLSAGSSVVVVVVTGVFVVSFGLPLLSSPRAGERVTCVEPGRVGTGRTSWRGVLAMERHAWEDVEQVVVPGRWEDSGVRLQLRDGTQVLLPGVPRDAGQRLAATHARACGDRGVDDGLTAWLGEHVPPR